MSKSLIITSRRGYAAVVVDEIIRVPHIRISIESDGQEASADANLDTSLVTIIITAAVAGAAGGFSSELAKQLAKALGEVVRNGGNLYRAKFGKSSAPLIGNTPEEVEDKTRMLLIKKDT